MNKTVIAVLLLGLVVAALAGEASKDKLEKMRMKKARVMAKKERMRMDKIKDGRREGALGKDMTRPKDLLREKYEELREQEARGTLTREEFKEQAGRLKDEAKRARADGLSARKEAARKTDETRNKRSTKEAMRKMKAAYKSKTVKARREQ